MSIKHLFQSFSHAIDSHTAAVGLRAYGGIRTPDQRSEDDPTWRD